jgi:plasmid stabilization system protein ParE
MQLKYRKEFIDKFENIWDFIAEDSQDRANNFRFDLKNKIENLSNMPYKFRKSYYFNDENIRDLIFKGYVIPYKIDTINETITIIGIKKYQENL